MATASGAAAPKRALIVVDVQKDFTPGQGGPLEAQGDGPSLIEGINSLLNSDFFDVKVGIQDFHPPVRVARRPLCLVCSLILWQEGR